MDCQTKAGQESVANASDGCHWNGFVEMENRHYHHVISREKTLLREQETMAAKLVAEISQLEMRAAAIGYCLESLQVGFDGS